MDAVTYPARMVQKELQTHWLTAKVDVANRQDVAELFDIHAIPVAVALDSGGERIGQILGFMTPEQMAAELGNLRNR